MTIDGRHVDVRVVTIPSVHGEGVVMRILDKESIRLELDKLGFQEHELTRFRRAFTQAYGCVLTTGPTGSGKSTSLYGALSELEHAGEEHHHDRGSGRVPDPRASRRFRSTTRRA